MEATWRFLWRPSEQASLEINSLTGEWEYFPDDPSTDDVSLSFDILLTNDNGDSISHPVSIYFEEQSQRPMGDLVELGRDGQPVISKSGAYVAIGLDNALLIKDVGDNSSKVIEQPMPGLMVIIR